MFPGVATGTTVLSVAATAFALSLPPPLAGAASFAEEDEESSSGAGGGVTVKAWRVGWMHHPGLHRERDTEESRRERDREKDT